MTPELTDRVAGIRQALELGRLIPFLGAGALPPDTLVPAGPEPLAALITARVAVPHKIRKRLTAAAQFIENFKHRKTLVDLMTTAFRPGVEPMPLVRWLAALPGLPMLVDTWYDDGTRTALAQRRDWGEVQGLSQAEHFGHWFAWYSSDGTPSDAAQAAAWTTLLYKPIGAVTPEANFLVSDSDYVEVLTEIDIQTPIPPEVQQRRSGRGFLFLGCRFNDQLQRSFARQIMKRSANRHFAVLPGAPTRNEQRFLQEQGIERLDLTLAEFERILIGLPDAASDRRSATVTAHAPEQVAGSLAS